MSEIFIAHDAQGLELPPPDEGAMAFSSRLIEAIVEEIEKQDGVIGFDRYMQMVLYQPGLGYYSSEAIKFGALGDFVTAPEISPMFGGCLARQSEAIISQGCKPRILEFGAGSGKLCADIVEALPQIERYLILDLSAELKQRQARYLKTRLSEENFDKLEWIDRLPQDFDGIVIANEVLDAMPVHLLQKRQDWIELGVGFDGQRFSWHSFPPDAKVVNAIQQIEARHGELPQNYRCELNLNVYPWFSALAHSCRQAAVIIIDYGYEQDQYYHPDRSRGTLACFYQHREHYDPLVFPGLQDITSFVDFDACADAAEAGGFELLGLVSQRHFLIENGLLEEAQRRSDGVDSHEQLAISQQVKTLSMPQQMGQEFKVLALQKNLNIDMPAMQRRGLHG